MRIAALDVGEARIGVAVSDELGITAQGVGVVRRVGGRRDVEALAAGLAPAGRRPSYHRPVPPVAARGDATADGGEALAEVAAYLARQGVLRHPRPLVLWARLTRQDRAVHWGEYLITRPLSPLELLA